MLYSRDDKEHAAEGSTSKRLRWRWHVLAFVPSVLMALVAASVPIPYKLMAYSSPNAAEDVVTIISWVGVGVVCGMPLYLYVLGRSYVRKVHDGLKSPGSFAILYSGANIALWLGLVFVASILYTGR